MQVGDIRPQIVLNYFAARGYKVVATDDKDI
jgi:hypothetical protein